MPRKQVYGKRSRAIYDPFQAFVSPQRPAPKSNIRDQGVFVAEVIEELSKLKVEEKTLKDGLKKTRKVLGEKNANETVDPVKAALHGGKPKRRRRKVVEEEGEDIENAWSRVEIKDESQRRKRSLERAGKEETPAPATIQTTPFVADNVPMFVDGHGYDTEIEETVKIQQISDSQHPEPRTKESSQDSETPSISILPPTPPNEDDPHAVHCNSLLELSSHGITNFTEWSNQIITHFSISKIAEASFGEVYRLSLLEDLFSFSRSDESVLKVIALKPPESSLPPTTKKKERTAALKNAEAMSRVEDVANEVRLLQRMSTIPGFTNFRDVRIMQGRPPQPFIKAFRDFNTEQKARKKEVSVFPDPAKKASYPEDQLWAVIEMQDAGVDLERKVEQGECSTIWAVWDIFWQVALTLGKGEEGAEFEHRDLHLGNICVRRPSGEASHLDGANIDTKRNLNFTTLETTIIDYTISRALLSTTTRKTSPASETPNIAYHNLSTPSATSIFEGDSTQEYQYDIYRYMRGCVLASDPYYTPTIAPTSGISPWMAYHPRTNLIWLHLILHTLLEALHWPSATKAPPKKRNNGEDFRRWKRANDLEHVLLRVQEVLDPGEICADSGLASAGALVGWALEEGWLGLGDVVGHEESGLVEGFERLSLGAGEDGRAVGEGDTLAEAEREEERHEAADGKKASRTRRKQ